MAQKKASAVPNGGKTRHVKDRGERPPLGLLYDGYSYDLRRSPKRRTLGLRVTRAREIVVYAPTRASEEQIRTFVLAHTEWIGHAVAKNEARLSAHPEPSREQMAAWRKAAKALLPERIAYFSHLTGLRPSGFRVSSAKTRFGSCSSKRTLSFSCRLMAYPPEAIDYVVLHEICHLAVMNHGTAFYSLLQKYMPDYKERERLLRR